MQLVVAELLMADSSLLSFPAGRDCPSTASLYWEETCPRVELPVTQSLLLYTFMGLPVLEIPVIFEMCKTIVWVVTERLRHKVLIFVGEMWKLPWK